MTKQIPTLAVAAALVAACSAPGAGPTPAAAPFIVIAHRGFSGVAPEHTLAAWDLAVAAGADYLEQDLQMSADGVLVVLHDATLDRTARGPAELCTGPVIRRTLEQLRRCDVGSWFNEARPQLARPEFRNARISTLDEVFFRYGGSARFYIETKNPEEAPGMEEALLETLRRHRLLGGGETPPRVLVQSFSPESLRKLHALEPSLALVQLFERRPSAEIQASLAEVRRYAVGIGPHFSSVDRALVEAAHAAGLVVHPYTVNDREEMRRLRAIGVDGFFTDQTTVAREEVAAGSR